MMHLLPRDSRWWPVPWTLGLAVATAAATCGPVDRAADAASSLVAALDRSGLHATAQDIVIVDEPASFGLTRAVVRAWRAGEPSDIFLLRAHLTPKGAVIDVPEVFNLTSTPMADETKPELAQGRVAFKVREAGQDIGIRVIDLAGESALDGDWPLLARSQNGVTNLQQTGQSAGVESLFWAVDPPSEVAIAFDNDGLLDATAPDCVVKLPSLGGDPIGQCATIQFRPSQKAHPGNLVTWAVDRVRALPWFGDERMQILKAVSFDAMDYAKRAKAKVFGDDSAAEIAEDLGDIGTHRGTASFTDPESGWPPPAMEPYLKNPLEGEGQWIGLENDPFIQALPGLPPGFVTSYIRTDRERSYTRIYVTAWDPRMIELHMMAGSVEPKGASGEAGPGLIPRTPETMKRLVGGMNGGFQALHGEFGMMGDGVIYLPPKPYAATVADLRDGSTGFGSWPTDTMIPPEVHSFRQNLTVLVLDGKVNPYKRGWWGGTPPDWEDRVHTTRSGICLTREGFIAFFYGNEIDVMPLAQAMVQARCAFGMHLDMNPGHTGLEFYKAAPNGTLPELGRAIDKKWEAEAPVEQMPGWTFRARRMVRFMGLMNFPRYVQREARDFFYLTLRPLLPGENLGAAIEPAEPEEGQWRTKGLPQHGFPFALATTTVRPDASRPLAKVYLLKIDPRMVSEGSAKAEAATVVMFAGASITPGQAVLQMSPRAFSIGTPVAEASTLLSGFTPGTPEAEKAVAAVGVQDDEGMLVYAEVQGEHKPGADAAMLVGLLDKLGCSTKLMLGEPLVADLGGADAGKPQGRQIRLVRAEAPGGRRIFPDTPIAEPNEWGPLQARRIRYFKKPKKAEGGDDAPE